MKPLLWIAVLVLVACSGGNVSGPGDDTPPGPGDPGLLFYLDLNSPTVVQPITVSDIQPGVAYRFVEVEIVEVLNPKRYALMFDVHYERTAGERTLLGSFALYPVDNPGRFIVATQGKVSNEGAILLTITSRDAVDRTDPLRVGVRRMRFVND